MYKWIVFLLVIGLFFLSGCTSSADDTNDDTAAVVRGEEITVGYLRLLYPDDAIGKMVDEAIKAKLAEQEVKKMNIDVSEQVKERKKSYGNYPDDKSRNTEAQSIRAFADPKAKELGMDPAKYYHKYRQISAEMSAYINTYASETLGELDDDEFGIEEYNQHKSELLDDLMERNKDDIDIKIDTNE